MPSGAVSSKSTWDWLNYFFLNKLKLIKSHFSRENKDNGVLIYVDRVSKQAQQALYHIHILKTVHVKKRTELG